MQLVPNPLIIPVGIIIGILVAAPVGPVNVLCIQRAIERGALGGIAAGLGAVLGDGLIALLAALGVGAVSQVVVQYRDYIQVVGGLALLAFGIKLYMAVQQVRLAPSADPSPATLRDFIWDVPQTFALTITNPGAVLGLFAIFGGVSSFVEVTSSIDALTMVAAIMAGSLLWWVALSYMVGRIRDRFTNEGLGLINRIAGLLLCVFAAVLLGEIVLKAAGVVS